MVSRVAPSKETLMTEASATHAPPLRRHHRVARGSTAHADAGNRQRRGDGLEPDRDLRDHDGGAGPRAPDPSMAIVQVSCTTRSTPSPARYGTYLAVGCRPRAHRRTRRRSPPPTTPSCASSRPGAALDTARAASLAAQDRRSDAGIEWGEDAAAVLAARADDGAALGAVPLHGAGRRLPRRVGGRRHRAGGAAGLGHRLAVGAAERLTVPSRCPPALDSGR